MEIKSGQSINQYKQPSQIQSKPEKKQEDTVAPVTSSAVSLDISPEARALYDDGGGHPERPKTKN